MVTPIAGRPKAEAFHTEEPHNRRQQAGQGRAVAEALRRFQEVLTSLLQTQRGSRMGHWEKAAFAPGSARASCYTVSTASHSSQPHEPHSTGTLLPGLGSSSEHLTPAPGFPNPLHPSASGSGRKPEKKGDPDPPCHHLFSEIFQG